MILRLEQFAMELGPFEILSGLAVVFLLVHYFFFSSWNFWKLRNVQGPEPTIFFGTMKDVILFRTSLAEYLKKVYDSFPSEPMVGIFARNTPILVLKDPDMIKDVMIKDFSTFSNRNRKIHKKIEPMSQNLVSLEAERWRPLRIRLSPVFTSGKLKEMFYILDECGDQLQNYMKKICVNGAMIDVREVTARFTTDVIGSAAFGLKMNAISDENSEFRELGRELFRMDWWKIIKFRIRESFPWLFQILGPLFRDSPTTKFFVQCMKQTIEHREKNNIRRNDFVDLLRDLRDHPDKINNIEFTDTLMAAQAFVFFVAGFETSSTAMSNTLYELALNQSIQKKVRDEINDVLKKNDGALTFDCVKSMTYLNKVFKESLRLFPPAPHTSRKSSAPYTFSGTKISIPKDQGLFIPILAIHRDPNIYPNPDVFDPERFSDENVKKRHPMHFLPFGEGPRNCIGSRFAVNQSKVGLIKMLQKYNVDVCEKTDIPYVFKASAVLLAPKNGIFLKFSKVD